MKSGRDLGLVILAILILFCSVSASYADTVTIGTGADTWLFPLATCYNSARAQSIYLASDIGYACTITGLSLDVTSATGSTIPNFTVRLKHTQLSAYSTNQWESDGWTVVYHGSITVSSAGWKYIAFATPFTYDGSSNLMVDISFSGYSPDAPQFCHCSKPSGNRTIFLGSTSNPLTWSGTTPVSAASTRLPNIQLAVAPLQTVAPPSFSLGGGYYDSAQNVVVRCSTDGSTIHYTTTGIDPTESDPVIGSGSSILVDHTLTLKAKAWKAIMGPSDVTSAAYRFQALTPSFSLAAGAYFTPQNVVVNCPTAGAVIRYTTNGADPTESDPVVSSGTSILVDHSLTLKAKAWKAGLDPSDVTTAVYSIQPAPPVFSLSAGTYFTPQNVTVTCATTGVVMHYTTNGADPTESDPIIASGTSVIVDHSLTLKARSWASPLAVSNLVTAVYSIVTATPTISPTGGVSDAPISVTMTCATPGADIHYTTTGADPLLTDPAVTSGASIIFNHSMILKVKAWANGPSPSAITGGSFTIAAATPTFSPDGGLFESQQQVLVSCSTAGVTIHYTTTGLDPTESDAVVASGATVTVVSTSTLKAKAWKTEIDPSTVKNALFRQARIFYVTPQGNDNNDGLSWPLAKRSVTAALQSAQSGDQVWVKGDPDSPFYESNLTINDGVALYGGFTGTETDLSQRPTFPRSSPDPHETILDGNQSAPVVRLSGNSEFTRIDGFTVRNGAETWTYKGAGGIRCTGSPTITNNIIRGNSNVPIDDGVSIAGLGGGISTWGGSPVISNNLIVGNSIECMWFCIASAYGGGVYCDGGSPIIGNNTIQGNTIYVRADEWWSAPIETSASAGGAGIYVHGGNPTISDNVITGNSVSSETDLGAYPRQDDYDTALGNGGGICIDGCSTANIVNNTVADNSVSVSATYYSSVDGGGIWFSAGAPSYISNNAVAFNTGGGICVSGTQPTLHNNDVYQNTRLGSSSDYSGVSPGIGDLPIDPLFVNRTDSDYHLTASSPCVEAGWDAAPSLPDKDTDGQARPYLDHVDIGAYEFVGSPVVSTPYFSSDGGTFNSTQNVKISCATPEAVIHFTTNGDTPTIQDAVVVSGANIPVNVSLTLKAAAFKASWPQSDVRSTAFTLKVGNISFTPDAGAYSSPRIVVVSCPTAGAVIHYTTNGVDPTEYDPIVASGSTVVVDHNLTLKAVGIIAGWTPSDVRSAYFVFRSPCRLYVKQTATGPDHDGLSWSRAFATVTDALRYSMAGDEIWVAAGTYTEPVTLRTDAALYGGFGGSESSLNERSEFPRTSPDARETRLSGGVVSPPGAGNNTRVDGFTISGGHNGGIRCADSYPTITNNHITGNSSVSGGAIYCSGGSSMARITNNVIENNVAEDNATSSICGAGIWCESASPVITGNAFTANIAGDSLVNWTHSGMGGAIYCHYGSPAIQNNTFTGNSSRNGQPTSYGAGIYCDYSPATISGNVFTGNIANYGGAIFANYSSTVISNNIMLGNGGYFGNAIYAYYSPAVIANNTMVGNGGTSGGCCVYTSYSPALISNNIVAFNTSGLCNTGSTTLRNNDVYANGSSNYSGISAGTGDISLDPLFLNRSGGDYHITYPSPCRNAGYNGASGIPAIDMDGQPRLNGVVDIGADEFWTPAGSIKDARCSADNASVDIDGAVISAAFPDFFYIQMPDKPLGIRVNKAGHALAEGMKVDIFGVARTNSDGEKYILSSNAVQSLPPNNTGGIYPLFVTNSSLGGADLNYDPLTGAGQCGVKDCRGPNNIGLLLTITGKVVDKDTSVPAMWFKVDDGCGVNVKAVVPSTVTDLPNLGQQVAVTGISSCEKSASDVLRLLRVRKQTDILKF